MWFSTTAMVPVRRLQAIGYLELTPEVT